MGKVLSMNGRQSMGSWLDLYMEHTSGLESPSVYHRWVGLTVLGHAMARRVWLPRGDKFPLFGAQMMVVLVGGSGIVRKTTAMNSGLDLYEGLPKGSGLVNVLPSRTSAQKLFQLMTPVNAEGEAMDAVALIAAPELGSFFSRESFNETMATHVIPLNDAPCGLFDHDTLAFGDKTISVKYMGWEEELTNPCLGLIACTTESGIARELPDQMLQGGFFGRVLWVWAAETDRPLNPLIDPELGTEDGAAILKQLIYGLHWAASLQGPMLLTKEAKRNFTDWYNGDRRAAEMHVKDDGLQTGYWPRKDSHILRVAMILNVAELIGQQPAWRAYRKAHRAELTERTITLPPVQWKQIETAMSWLRELETGREICTRELGRTKKSQLPMKILRMLERRARDKGWADRILIVRRMHRTCGANAEEVDRALSLLREAKEVKRLGMGKQTRWKRRMQPGPFGIEEAAPGGAPDPGVEHDDA
jgi:hypothetical protein